MYVYPPAPEESTCVLLFVPGELVPIVGALFGQLERRAAWASDADWQQGYKAFVALEEQLVNNCMNDLVAELRNLRGIKPEYDIVLPEDRTSDMYRSFNDLIQSNMDMRGVLSDGWFTDPQYATIADMVQALRGTNSDTGKGLWDDISQLISDASGVAGIANFITNLLSSTEEAIVEGGLMMGLVALSAANAAIMQQMLFDNAANAVKVNAILLALRGNTAPDDNVLQALRGDADASDTRNVVSLLE